MSTLPAIRQTLGQLTAEQIDILRDTVFKELTNEEMRFAIQVCNRTQLDPFVRQIHFVKRKDNKTGKVTIAIQTGIDGFRLQAQRSGEYAGSDDPIFDDEHKPQKATVTVYRIVKGVRCAYTATARWAEYYPGDPNGFMWRKMPCTMLSKCAEALALRKAFPAELSDMYIREEMDQAESSRTVIQTKIEEVNQKLGVEEQLEPELPKQPEGKPLCRLCFTEMKVSKAGTGYYCPNFQNTEMGEHTRFRTAELAKYLAEQEVSDA